MRVGNDRAAVLAHCGTAGHLHAYERLMDTPLTEWCPVSINDQHMLVDHHALFVHRVTGAGRVLVDECLPGGMLLLPDACQAVQLKPLHRYRVAELVLPPYASDSRKLYCTSTADGGLQKCFRRDMLRWKRGCARKACAGRPRPYRQLVVDGDLTKIPRVSGVGREYAPLHYSGVWRKPNIANMEFSEVLRSMNRGFVQELRARRKLHRLVKKECL